MKNLLCLIKCDSLSKNYFLLIGSLLMVLSFFLPWVTVGSVFSGYELAHMYSRMYDDNTFLRFVSVPKVAFGIIVLLVGNAPKNLVYYGAPVLSLIPLAVLDGDMLEYPAIHYGFYLLHLAVILIWVGAFSYKYQSG